MGRGGMVWGGGCKRGKGGGGCLCVCVFCPGQRYFRTGNSNMYSEKSSTSQPAPCPNLRTSLEDQAHGIAKEKSRLKVVI